MILLYLVCQIFPEILMTSKPNPPHPSQVRSHKPGNSEPLRPFEHPYFRENRPHIELPSDDTHTIQLITDSRIKTVSIRTIKERCDLTTQAMTYDCAGRFRRVMKQQCAADEVNMKRLDWMFPFNSQDVTGFRFLDCMEKLGVPINPDLTYEIAGPNRYSDTTPGHIFSPDDMFAIAFDGTPLSDKKGGPIRFIGAGMAGHKNVKQLINIIEHHPDTLDRILEKSELRSTISHMPQDVQRSLTVGWGHRYVMTYLNKPAEFSFYTKLTSGVIKATTTSTGDTELTLFAYSGNGPITAIRVKCGDSESWTTATEPHHQSKYTHATAAASCPGSPKTVTVSAKDSTGWQPGGPANCNWAGVNYAPAIEFKVEAFT